MGQHGAICLEDYYFSLLKPESNLENGAALSATTIRHHHQNISKALADAVRKGYIPLNPASSARLPKKEKYKAEFLNHEQLDELVSLFKGICTHLPKEKADLMGRTLKDKQSSHRPKSAFIIISTTLNISSAYVAQRLSIL